MQRLFLVLSTVILLLSAVSCSDVNSAIDAPYGDDDIITGDSQPDGEDGDSEITDDELEIEFPDEGGDQPDETSCSAIGTQPSTLDFGYVPADFKAEKTFFILNVSAADPLEIYDIVLVDGQYNGFDIISDLTVPENKLVIQPGDSSDEITVSYFPTISENNVEGTIAIVSNDCNQPIYRLPLRAGDKCNHDGKICVQPTLLDFGEIQLGEEPKIMDIEISNCCDEISCDTDLTISDITLYPEASPHFQILYGKVNPLDPLILHSGERYYVGVAFHPQTLADEFNPHRARIMIISDSYEPDTNIIEVNALGTATSSSISIYPTPINFGDATVTDIACSNDVDCPRISETCRTGSCGKEMDISVYNWGDTPIAILDVQLTDDDGESCSAYSLINPENLLQRPCETDLDCPDQQVCYGEPIMSCRIQPGASSPGSVRLRFEPPDHRDYNRCQLSVQTPSLLITTPISGTGIGLNQQPVARISLQSHGAPIETPINGLSVGARLCFYGNISFDPDGELMRMQWEIAGPDGSMVEFSYMDPSQSVICLDFSAPGDYLLSLKVMDNDGAWSDPAEVSISVNSVANEYLLITYSTGPESGILGLNLIDWDWFLDRCNLEVMAIGQQCQSSMPDTPPSVQLIERTQHDGVTSILLQFLTETDGVYELSGNYLNDCADWYDQFVLPFCGQRLEGKLSWELYTSDQWPGGQPMYPPIEEDLTGGDSSSWRIVRLNGQLYIPGHP